MTTTQPHKVQKLLIQPVNLIFRYVTEILHYKRDLSNLHYVIKKYFKMIIGIIILKIYD